MSRQFTLIEVKWFALIARRPLTKLNQSVDERGGPNLPRRLAISKMGKRTPRRLLAINASLCGKIADCEQACAQSPILAKSRRLVKVAHVI
jgi:hypothetical protein